MKITFSDLNFNCSFGVYFHINLASQFLKLATVIIIAIKLRKIHDAYWMKYELFGKLNFILLFPNYNHLIQLF